MKNESDKAKSLSLLYKNLGYKLQELEFVLNGEDFCVQYEGENETEPDCWDEERFELDSKHHEKARKFLASLVKEDIKEIKKEIDELNNE